MVHEEHRENLLDVVRALLGDESSEDAVALLTSRHPADQADLLEDLDEESRDRLLVAFSPAEAAHVLEYLNEDLRRRVLNNVAPELLAPILDALEEDVAVDIVQELDPEKAQQVVPLLQDRANVEVLLTHDEETAGGRMSLDVLTLQRDWTVDAAISFLREQQPGPEQAYYLYVVDHERRLRGVVNLRDLIVSQPLMHLEDIMNREVISIPASSDQEVAAERMRHYDLLALPVVDDDGRLLGVITPDDVLDVQVEEATEDMYRMAGLDESESLFRPIRQSVPPRLGWLLLNLGTALLAAATVSLFEGTIEKVAALAVFMPMVAGMGGNAGIQTITLVVRSLALGEIDINDAARVLKHEAIIALIKGIVIGCLVGLLAWVWKDSAWLGVIVGLALVANIANATLVGALVPLGLKVVRADPALASGVIVTTFSDVMGFLFFLGLATILVSRLT